ncbi:hypothetical protein LCGC14_2298780, partial [marine sediment metagenome]
ISSYCSKCNAWRGAYGLEPNLQSYIDHTVEWCREVWRVLRDDGTFWLNLGDSYAGSGNGAANYPGDYPKQNSNTGSLSIKGRAGEVPIGLKPKDLMGVPWRVALALQADGWYLRSDIIWHKTNPMPESVTDRPTKSHEYLFLLTKSKKYFYDMDAIREVATPDTSIRDRDNTKLNNTPGRSKMGGLVTNHYSSRNRRTVWTIATAPYSGAHFATYPPALVEPCIKVGTSAHGVCPECGNPWKRISEVWYEPQNKKGYRTKTPRVKGREAGHDAGGVTPQEMKHGTAYRKSKTIGWEATCEHKLEPIPATVIDPYFGSGTTLLVARKLGRNGIGLDISADYIDLAKERLSIKALEQWEQGKPGETDLEGLPLFKKQPEQKELL